jgi:hypothetical protein
VIRASEVEEPVLRRGPTHGSRHPVDELRLILLDDLPGSVKIEFHRPYAQHIVRTKELVLLDDDRMENEASEGRDRLRSS